MAVFAKFQDIDGESRDANHDKWIDVLSVEWGSSIPSGGTTGQSRRRGAAVVRDVKLRMEYEVATIMLIWSHMQGQIIPRVDIESTATYGGARMTYLKHVLQNVDITKVDILLSANDEEAPPIVIVELNPQALTIEYTCYDDTGHSRGNAFTEVQVERGTSTR